MNPPPAEARHLVIHGRVQGVGFRQSMQREATRLGLTGWVRNCRNGTVEAVMIGSAEAVAALLVWARHGPPLAQVEQLTVALPAAHELSALVNTSSFVQRGDHG